MKEDLFNDDIIFCQNCDSYVEVEGEILPDGWELVEMEDGTSKLVCPKCNKELSAIMGLQLTTPISMR